MSEFNENAKDLKRKASELYDTAKEQAANVYSETKPKVDDLAEQIGTTASDLYKSGKQCLGQAEGYVEESMDCMAQSIRKQPLTSVLVATGVGYLLGKLFK